MKLQKLTIKEEHITLQKNSIYFSSRLRKDRGFKEDDMFQFLYDRASKVVAVMKVKESGVRLNKQFMKQKITLLIDEWLVEHYNDDTTTEQLSIAILELIIDDIRQKIPKSIYLNGLRKFNKSIPTVNAFNSYRKEVLKIFKEYKKEMYPHALDMRTKV